MVPLWFIIISLVFCHLCKALFLGFLQFQGNFVDGQNKSKYREAAPLSENDRWQSRKSSLLRISKSLSKSVYLPTCAKHVLPSCREGSPYVYLLQIFQVFQPVVLYIGEQYCSPVGLYCWRNRWWHRHQDVLYRVLAEEALELGLQKIWQIGKLKHGERKIRL